MLLDLSYTCVEGNISQLFLRSNGSGTTAIISLLYTAYCIYIYILRRDLPLRSNGSVSLVCTYVYMYAVRVRTESLVPNSSSARLQRQFATRY